MKSSSSSSSSSAHAASPISIFRRFFRKLLPPAAKPKPKPKPNEWQWDGDGDGDGDGKLCVSKDIHSVFNYFDEDGDGKISPCELQSRVNSSTSMGVGEELQLQLQLSDEEAEMVVRASDADGDGMLGLEDFAKMLESGEEEDKVEELNKAFRMYSTCTCTSRTKTEKLEGGGEGVITPKSLKRMLSRLGRRSTINECKAMIGRFDLNADGVVDFNEFNTMMRSTSTSSFQFQDTHVN